MPTATTKSARQVTVGNGGWTRLDTGLANRHWVEGMNLGAVAVGVLFGADPGAGTAWNADGAKPIQPGGEIGPWAAGAALQLWARAESGSVDCSCLELGT